MRLPYIQVVWKDLVREDLKWVFLHLLILELGSQIIREWCVDTLHRGSGHRRVGIQQASQRWGCQVPTSQLRDCGQYSWWSLVPSILVFRIEWKFYPRFASRIQSQLSSDGHRQQRANSQASCRGTQFFVCVNTRVPEQFQSRRRVPRHSGIDFLFEASGIFHHLGRTRKREIHEFDLWNSRVYKYKWVKIGYWNPALVWQGWI